VRTGEVEEVGVKTAGGGDCFERETGSVVQVFLPQTSVSIGSLTVGPTSWSNHRPPEPWELRALLRLADGLNNEHLAMSFSNSLVAFKNCSSIYHPNKFYTILLKYFADYLRKTHICYYIMFR
jgi:hypothetical protein